MTYIGETSAIPLFYCDVNPRKQSPSKLHVRTGFFNFAMSTTDSRLVGNFHRNNSNFGENRKSFQNVMAANLIFSHNCPTCVRFSRQYFFTFRKNQHFLISAEVYAKIFVILVHFCVGDLRDNFHENAEKNIFGLLPLIQQT